MICEYFEYERYQWPKHLLCLTHNANLSITARNDKFSFSGSPEQKIATKTLWFEFKGTAIDFLPTGILTDFPNLNGLILNWADWPIVRSLIFTSHFKRIQHIIIDNCNIEKIADNAFAELTELKWISIWNSRITYLKRETFQHNLKLEYLFVNTNRIQMINSRFFDNFNSLKEIHFSDNFCVDASLVEPFTRNDITRTFQKCFGNCRSDENCSPPLDDFRIEVDEQFSNISTEISNLKATDGWMLNKIYEMQQTFVTKFEFSKFASEIREEIDGLKKNAITDLMMKGFAEMTEKIKTLESKLENC
jgi:hypothetical protein